MRASDNAILEGGEFEGETVSATFDVRLTIPSRSTDGLARIYQDSGSYKEHKDRLLRVFTYRGDSTYRGGRARTKP